MALQERDTFAVICKGWSKNLVDNERGHSRRWDEVHLGFAFGMLSASA